jgi:hypothetical protein
MLERAYIQQEGRNQVEPEMADLAKVLGERGVAVEFFTEKASLRGRLKLTPRTLVAGWVSVVDRALRQLGVEPPEPDDYPTALHLFLHRRVWRSTLGRLRDDLAESVGRVFIKPAEKRKRFTGRVVETEADLWSLAGVSAQTSLWCSEPVEFLSEQRFFVFRNKVVGARHYEGDPKLEADRAEVERATRTLENEKTPVAYALDFGVLRSGQTALVERNDFYALGSYGLDAALYTELTVARWEELLAKVT